MIKKLFGILVLLFSFSIFSEEAVISFVKGKVNSKTSNEKKYKKVKRGDKISEGTTLVTGSASTVTITYNGSEFKLMPNTQMVIGTFPGGAKPGEVEIAKGFGWFKIENAGKNGFKANTPSSTAGVRGTSFATMYEPKAKTAMNCICHGQVEVSDTNDKSLVLDKGFGSVVVGGIPGVKKTEYKDDFEKAEVLPSFEKKIKASPILKNCLSCHKTKGWNYKGITKDSTYGK